MVNVNIEIPDELHRKLKLAAVLGDTTIKELFIELLDDAERPPLRRARAPRP